MTTQQEIVQIQQKSHGIKPDLEVQTYKQCYYSEMAENGRNEEYYFPCSMDHQCCGRECCTAVAGGFPLWLVILLCVLGFLLLLLLLFCIIYCCWRYCCRQKKAPTPPPKKPPLVVERTLQAPPPPKVEMYTRTPLLTGGTLRRMSDDNLIEMKSGSAAGYSTNTNTATTPVSLNSSSTTPSYYYGHSTATRPKNLQNTTITNTAGIGNVSPKHKARRINAFRNHQHSTATDSSPGDEQIGERSHDPLLSDRQHNGGTNIHHPAIAGSGSERYSLTMTTPTSNTASEREPSFVPSPMEETYERAPRPIPVEIHDTSEISQERHPLLSNVDTPREMKARVAVLRTFVPDPMEEIILPPPTREQIGYHFVSEISKERYPEQTVIEPPQGKRAQVIYCIPGEDRVAAY